MKGLLTTSVIIPTLQPRLCEEMLETLFGNTILPRQIIVINNSKTPIAFKGIEEVIAGWGVNKSWSEGFKRVLPDTDLVSVLNDDILLNRRFFENLQEVFLYNLRAGIVVPNTAHTLEEFRYRLTKDEPQNIRKVIKREGWAFTIRKFVLDKIPAIPKRLDVFFGDDWIFNHCHQLGYDWLRDATNWIYHMGGKTTNLDFNRMKERLQVERGIYAAINNGKR